jgi:hypothetical protein
MKSLASVLSKLGMAAAALSLLAALLGSAPAQGAAPAERALILVEARSPEELAALAAERLPVYARLYPPQGGEALLLPATDDQARLLRQRGLALHRLEADAGEGAYTLLSALRPGALGAAQAEGVFVYADAQQAVARLRPGAAERLPLLGVQLRQLRLHPLAVEAAVPALPASITPDARIQAMINQVTLPAVSSTNGNLSGENAVIIGGSPYTLLTRYSRSDIPIQKATQYAFERLNALGLAAVYHEYDLPGSGLRRNVIAEQAGVTQPERILLITAHLDSTSGDPYNLAPGADDNASGSTAVLLAAQILSQYSFDCTLRYALFTGEEQGLIGAEAYAAQVDALGENVESVLNLDMIAYNSDAAKIIELHTRPGNASDAALAALFSDVNAAYGLGLVPEIEPSGIQASDHAAFWQYGIPAILAIEDFEDFTPYYHTTGDTLDTLDLDYFTRFIKAAVGTFAHMGCLRPASGGLSGVVSEAGGGPLAGALVEAAPVVGMPITTLSGGAGGYALALPPGFYDVNATLPGYAPFHAENILVSDSVTTTLDIAMPYCYPITAADFSYAPADPAAGETIHYTATATVNGTAPLSYAWTFGDGDKTTGPLASHSYAVSGTYTTTLTVSNCAGQRRAAQAVPVSGEAEAALLTAEIAVSANPTTTAQAALNFSNLGTAPLEWTLSEDPAVDWLQITPEAGSLAPFSSQAAVAQFGAPAALGVYTTTLLLASNDADEPLLAVPVTLTVTAACLPVGGLDFSYTPLAPRPGQEVSFSAQMSSGSLPATFTWEWDDGTPPASGEGLEQMAHAFPFAPGSQMYLVRLIAANGCGAPAAADSTVVVTAWPAYLPWVAVSP